LTAGRFVLSPATVALLADLGVPVPAVLRVAGLPGDLFLSPQVSLTPAQFYALWTALESVTGDPAFGVTMAGRVTAEVFQPPLFAALCSPDLRHAAERMAAHKRLIGPLTLTVADVPEGLRLTLLQSLPGVTDPDANLPVPNWPPFEGNFPLPPFTTLPQ